MSDWLTSVTAAVAGNSKPGSYEFDYVGRFELNPRGIIWQDNKDGSGFILTMGPQLSAWVGAGSVGSVDGRLYAGVGNNNFEFSITAGYSHGFLPESFNSSGFALGTAIQFNPIFFLINQPFWAAAGYDVRCYDSRDFEPMHMVWVGVSLMLDWVWNPARYADPPQPPNS